MSTSTRCDFCDTVRPDSTLDTVISWWTMRRPNDGLAVCLDFCSYDCVVNYLEAMAEE